MFYREIFSLTVAGQEIYVVTSPNDISAIYRESSRLEYDSVAKEAMKQFGWTSETVDRMYDLHGMAKHGLDQNHEDVKLQMHPGPRLEELQAKFLEHIERLIIGEQGVCSKSFLSTAHRSC